MEEYQLSLQFNHIRNFLNNSLATIGMELPRACLVRQVFSECQYPPRETSVIRYEILEDLPRKISPPLRYAADPLMWFEKWKAAAARWVNVGETPTSREDVEKILAQYLPEIHAVMIPKVDVILKAAQREMQKAPTRSEPLRIKISASCAEYGRIDAVRIAPEILSRLWRRNNNPADIYKVLKRYSMLMTDGAANLHGQVPPSILEMKDGAEGFAAECFASPLYAHLPRYYSAFPEIDRAFGSLGNFFAAPPTSGLYECNPPFSAEVINKLVEVVKSGSARFLIIVPCWDDMESIQWLRAQPSCVLAPSSHYYISGSIEKPVKFYPPSPTLISYVHGSMEFVERVAAKWTSL